MYYFVSELGALSEESELVKPIESMASSCGKRPFLAPSMNTDKVPTRHDASLPRSSPC